MFSERARTLNLDLQHYSTHTQTCTDKFRPISLTSCFSKVLERIFLDRLMFRQQPKLLPQLYSFLPQQGTHHCLSKVYTRLTPTSVAAFIDLKSAFDAANRDVILDRLAEFGVKDNLLRWICSYLSNRTARIFLRERTSKSFDLGTPHGSVFSPFLFNVLIHSLSLLPFQCSHPPSFSSPLHSRHLTCYADDICIHSNSTQNLQLFLHAFYSSTPAEKSWIFSSRNPRSLLTVGDGGVPQCTQNIYVGAPLCTTPAIPARQRIHTIVKELLNTLEQRFIPV